MITVANFKDVKIKQIEHGGFYIFHKGEKYYINNTSFLKLLNKTNLTRLDKQIKL